MLFQWLSIFFGSPPREADFWNHWNSQFHDAQNPSQKHGFIFDHKFHEIWCAQNASQRSLFRIFIVLALDFCRIKESALPRITPLTFFSCCRAGASTHSWFLQHLPIENRFFECENLKSVNAVRVFHLGHQNCHHHFCLFKFEWETLHYFDSFFALEIFKIATRQTHVRATFFLQFQDFVTIRIAILAQGFSSDGKSGIPTLGAEHKKKFVLRP